MNDRPPDGQARGPAGLCDRCANVQRVTSARGSRFYLCRLSFADPRFPRYPTIPVLSCSGFSPADPGPPSSD
jgi:hypothetical protein